MVVKIKMKIGQFMKCSRHPQFLQHTMDYAVFATVWDSFQILILFKNF